MTNPMNAAGLLAALNRAEEGAGTLPAKEAVKLRPADWRALANAIRALAAINPVPAAPVVVDRDEFGRLVREAWVRWAEKQPNPKPSWLVPYDELSEPDKEADRQIGETMFLWSKIHLEASSALVATSPAPAVEWAVEKWNDEVKNRPLVNVHRRSLDDTWRQVIRHFGGDDKALCGPNHDDLLSAKDEAKQ